MSFLLVGKGLLERWSDRILPGKFDRNEFILATGYQTVFTRWRGVWEGQIAK